MHLVQITDVSKGFGSQDVLEGVHWRIKDGAKIALVGRNGSGKTTLFRLLTGELEPERGTVWLRKGAVIAVMEQETVIEDDRTLRDEAARGLQHIQELQDEFDAVTRSLGETQEGSPDSADLLERYSVLQERLEAEGAYTFESRIQSVLEGLHFTDRDLDRPLREFSGGQKNRAILARVLLRDPDLLLLDEPTNHLDLDAIEWLEGFLGSYQGAFVVISHDRMFMNRLAKEVVEIRGRRLHSFQGNYEDFLVEREQRLEDQLKKYEMQQEEIRRQEDFIRRNIVGQKTKQAQSRRNRLERMERLEAPEWPASSIRMKLPPPERTARIVVEAKKLAKSYGTIDVFSDVSFLIQRGQKVGLIGPNGVGKSTLIRELVGEESPDRGELKIGPGVQIGYFEQEQSDLRGPQSALEEVWKVTPQASEEEIRTFLGGFLLRGDSPFKALNHLSGGEKSRVALAKLVREGSNFLILDEPTNHLDIESREVFEAALQSFTGTVLLVSHDRYFLDQVADHVIEMTGDGCQVWEGGYSHFARGKQALDVTKATLQAPTDLKAAQVAEASKEERKRQYEEAKRRQRDEQKLRRRIQDAEGVIATLEERKEGVLFEMADPAVATEPSRLQELATQLKGLESDLEAAIIDWERLETRLTAYLDKSN